MSGVNALTLRVDGTPGFVADAVALEVPEVLPQAAAPMAATATRLSRPILPRLWDPWPPILWYTCI